MIRFPLTAALLSLAAAVLPAAGARAADDRAFELRTYTAEDGKLDALHRRFREHTVDLFRKHGMEVVGFWVPASGDEAANTLVYLLAFPSREARDAAWKAFGEDPEWKKVAAESQVDGRLVKKIESKMLDPTDYSPLK